MMLTGWLWYQKHKHFLFSGGSFFHESTGVVALSRRLENKTWQSRRKLISLFPNSLKVGELTRASWQLCSTKHAGTQVPPISGYTLRVTHDHHIEAPTLNGPKRKYRFLLRWWPCQTLPEPWDSGNQWWLKKSLLLFLFWETSVLFLLQRTPLTHGLGKNSRRPRLFVYYKTRHWLSTFPFFAS